MKTTRFTVSIPTELVEEADRVLGKGEGRSALVRKLIEDALRAVEKQREIEQYIRGYTENPQTEEEFGWLTPVAAESLGQVPWD